MRPPEPLLTTLPTSDGVQITVRYETPEMGRAVASASNLIGAGLGVAFGLIGLGLLGFIAPARNDLWIGALVVTALASLGIGRLASDVTFRNRLYIAPQRSSTLSIFMTRTHVQVGMKRFARDRVLRFTTAPHREARQEERDERLLQRPLPTVYRNAHQVWLQYGERLVLLADVSDEYAAAAIVRRLQDVDEHVTRGHSQPVDASAFGVRPVPI